MDYQQEQVIAMGKANILQNAANNLQQKMIKETKKNNEVTSKHNKVMIGLSVAIVFLAFVTLLINYNKTGRYAMLWGKDWMYVLDTKTSQLWVRTISSSVYLGTNENPMFEKTIKQGSIGTKSETSKNNN